MLMPKIAFTRPECVALNRKGELSPNQRRKYFLESLLYIVVAAVSIAVAGVCVFGGKYGMAAICVFVGVMMFFVTKESWLISRHTKAEFRVLSGELHQVERIAMGKGGTVGIGKDKIYLGKEQLREVRFGHRYEIFVILPYHTAISAEAVDI
jgi:hypothetical protein